MGISLQNPKQDHIKDPMQDFECALLTNKDTAIAAVGAGQERTDEGQRNLDFISSLNLHALIEGEGVLAGDLDALDGLDEHRKIRRNEMG